MHLQSCSIVTSQSISVLTQSQFWIALRNSFHHGLQALHYQVTAAIPRHSANRGRQSNGAGIFGKPCGRLTWTHFHLISSSIKNTHSIFPHFWSHLLIPRFPQSRQLGAYSVPSSIISSHLRCCETCGASFMVSSVQLGFVISLHWPRSGASLGSPNRHLKVVVWLCSTTICGQIGCIYIQSDTVIMDAILEGREYCDCNKEENDKCNTICIWTSDTPSAKYILVSGRLQECLRGCGV